MIYSDFNEKKLSSLALGCMRLPTIGGNDAEIDMNAAKEMVAYAMENGINYYDTAWGYHSGNSEIAIGEILSNYPRESFYLATKFPGYDLANMNKVEDIFAEQLKKCRVDYFDFYLFHNVCEMNIDAYLNAENRILDYLKEQNNNGRIKHIGFSTHGNLDTIKRFLEAYGDDMEFCQLQVNWLDWTFQNAKEKIELVSSYGIPVWVMEPVRGGSLVNIEDDYVSELKKLRPNATVAEWAFRFLQTLPEVKVTLSGMSNFEQLKENIATYESFEPLTDVEFNTLMNIAQSKAQAKSLPCTSCRYCTSHCPMELNIPWLIELYNEHVYSNGGFIAPMALSSLSENKLPSACLGCRACEAVCPQTIKISEAMANFADIIK